VKTQRIAATRYTPGGMLRARPWVPLLLAAVALFSSACDGGSRPRPNVLLITVDTLRPDRLGVYGYAGIQTPNIDGLATAGAVFEYAVADTPWTTPSMASVMTGLYATGHGFKSSSVDRLAGEQVTLAETLKKEGYQTAAVIGSFPLDSVYRLDQGFDSYDDEFTTPILGMPDHEPEHLESRFFESVEEQRYFIIAKAMNDSRREDAEVTDAALAWLAEGPTRPFFLWVHYFGPHEKPDWKVPEAQRERRRLRMYDSDTRITDREVGRLLRAVDASVDTEDTLVVFHADHGESLGEQLLFGHGQLLNGASLRIPLILRYPARIEPGIRIARLARNVDIFPTVLDAAGVETPTALAGRSLLPLASSRTARWWAALGERRGAGPISYMETYFPAHTAFATPVTLPDGSKTKVGVIRRGIQTKEWKFVRTEPHAMLDVPEKSRIEVPKEIEASLIREELYHLTAPGGENEEVSSQHPRVVAEMRAMLERAVAEERDTRSNPPRPVDPETKLRLKSLGYGE